MLVKGTKLKEITKSEYEDIQMIYSISTCHKDAQDKVFEYLKEKLEYVNKDIAYNVLNAVIYNYKYMKVVD